MSRSAFTIAAMVLLGSGLPAQRDSSPTDGPDVVLYHGKIATVNAAFDIAEAIAIRGERIVAVGSDAQVRALADPSTRQVDLGGRLVVPGLADNHLHSAGGGPGVDLSRTRSFDDLRRQVAERAARVPKGEVILTNADWHEAQLREQRLPLRRDLDAFAPDHPLVMVRGAHEYILNSAALAKWNIATTTTVPAGGRISRYPDGELNGELVGAAKALVELPPPGPQSLDDMMRAEAAQHRKLLAAGLTSIRHPGTTPDQYRTLQEMRRRGQLTLRVNVLLRPPADLDAAGVRAYLARSGIRPDEGDEWLRIGGVKLVVDGGFEGGWMTEPYAEPWGEGGKYHGLPLMPADRYTSIVMELNRAGWRVATHAVGDAAIDLVLHAYEAADAERSILDRRWAIEHGFIPRLDQFPRMKKLGLALSVQDHLYLAGPSLVKYWGPTRAFWTTPVRAYLDAGIPLSAGSDSPVVPYNPFWVMYHFVTRDTITGGVMGADQKIDRRDALRLSTTGNARLTFEDGIKGSLEVGKLADLVVLSHDVLAGPEKQIEGTRPLMTMVGGRVVYQDPAFPATMSPQPEP